MNADYEPSTTDVRQDFVSLGTRLTYERRGELFDRWYKEARNDARADAWDECAAAIAWCLANGSDAELDALLYVTENNPYRRTSSGSSKGGA